MSRYNATSIEFGEELQKDLIKRKQKEAKDQERFAKKLAGVNFVVKGASALLDNRTAAFNNSLLDEKTYLETQRKRAKTLIDQKNLNEKSNISDRDYVDNILANKYQDFVEGNVEGIMIQKEINGEMKTMPAYDVSKASLRNMTDFKIGKKTYSNYEELLNESVTAYKNAITQAKDVPIDAASVQTYLDKYTESEMPTNLIDAIGRPVKRLLRGETRETLEDKIKKSKEVTLSSPIFKQFTSFGASMRAYDAAFPEFSEDMLTKIKQNFTVNSDGKITSSTYNKTVAEIKLETKIVESTSESGVDNTKTITKLAQPVTEIVYTDGSSETIVDEDAQTPITNGKQLLVVLDAPLKKTLDDTLTAFGIDEWNKYQQNNLEESANNPMVAYNNFIISGQDPNNINPNKYLKGDFDLNEVLVSFSSAASKDLINIVKTPTQGTNETDEEYALRVEDASKENQKLILQMYEDIINPAQELTRILGIESRQK